MKIERTFTNHKSIGKINAVVAAVTVFRNCSGERSRSLSMLKERRARQLLETVRNLEITFGKGRKLQAALRLVITAVLPRGITGS